MLSEHIICGSTLSSGANVYLLAPYVVILVALSAMCATVCAQNFPSIPCALNGYYVERGLDSAIRKLKSVNSALPHFAVRTGGGRPTVFVLSCDEDQLRNRIMEVMGMYDGVPWVVDSLTRNHDMLTLHSTEGALVTLFEFEWSLVSVPSPAATPLTYMRVGRSQIEMQEYVNGLTIAGRYTRRDSTTCTFTADGRYIVADDTLRYRVRYEANDGWHDVLELGFDSGSSAGSLYEIEHHGAEVILYPVTVDEESYVRIPNRIAIRLTPG